MTSLDLKSLKDYLVFGTPILIILGFISEYVYYSFFYLPIQDYIEITEIITAFLDNSVFISVSILFIVLIFRSRLIVLDNPLWKSKKLTRIYIITFVLSFLITGTYLVFIKGNYYAAMGLITGFIYILIAFSMLFYHLKQYRKHQSFKHLPRLILIYTIIMYFQIQIQYAIEVKYFHNTIGSELVYSIGDSTNTIISDSSVFYIGKSKNYLFLYDKKTNLPIVFPSTKIEKLKVASDVGLTIRRPRKK